VGFKSDRPAPLSGIRILDCADEKAGFCTRLLADMGARVIKVETPGGDAARNTGPFYRGDSQSTASLSFCYHNTNKLGVTLDLECEEGREIFVKLVKETDVIVETFSSGFLRRCGLSVETLRSTHPGIIWVSVTGFGRSGPRRDYKACDLVLSAWGGQMHACGSPAAAPLKAFGGQSQYAASLFAATAILLALRSRSQTGEGDHIDISLQAAVTATLEHVMHRYFAEGIIHRRKASRHWNEDFCVLPCKDGFIQATLSQQWETLIEWLDGEGMAADLKSDQWRDEAYRREHIAHVIEILKKWTAAHTRAEIFELAQLMRLPWASVQTPGEIVACPQLNARHFFVEQACLEAGNVVKTPGRPYACSSGPKLPNEPAPRPGEHNDRIYRQELGIAEKKLKQLYARKII
jgi:crotonobetainyl-CoA:carnitine CoA-transferase CaiB-like acyl-CoA transferase